MSSTCYSCQIVTKLIFPQLIFQKSSNIMKIRPVWSESFYTDGRLDSQDEYKSRFSQFLESSLKNAITIIGTYILHSVIKEPLRTP